MKECVVLSVDLDWLVVNSKQVFMKQPRLTCHCWLLQVRATTVASLATYSETAPSRATSRATSAVMLVTSLVTAQTRAQAAMTTVASATTVARQATSHATAPSLAATMAATSPSAIGIDLTYLHFLLQEVCLIIFITKLRLTCDCYFKCQLSVFQSKE